MHASTPRRTDRDALGGVAVSRAHRIAFALAMLVVAAIHLMPLAGLAGDAMLERLYGIAVDDDGLRLLLRHRALLFGLLGVLVLVAIARPSLRDAALSGAWISCAGFLLLAWPVDSLSAPLQRVFLADVIALAALIVATALHLRRRGGHDLPS
jgi:hypothetical protein